MDSITISSIHNFTTMATARRAVQRPYTDPSARRAAKRGNLSGEPARVFTTTRDPARTSTTIT